MNLLKDNWTYAKVSDFAELLRGISYKKDESRKESQKGYKPMLRSNNINYELNFIDLVYIPEKKIKSIQFIKEGDIIFAMSSGSKHLVGKSAQSKRNYDGSYGAFCGLLRVSNLMNKKYVGLFFKSQEYRKYISRISKGTNINNLKRDHILEINFPLAPLNEQNRIVEKIEELFSDLDKATEELKKTQEQLKIYRQAVLKAAFKGKLTEKWREQNNIELSFEEISLIDVADIILGQSPPSSTYNTNKVGLPFYQGKKEFGDLYPTPEKYCSEPKKIAESNDILISVRAPVGPTNFCKEKSCIGRGLAAIRVKERVKNFYLFYYLRYFIFNLIEKSTGTTFNAISKNILEGFKVSLFSLQEQQQIINEIESRLFVCNKIEETVKQGLNKIYYLRQSILKKAFEGKLVPQDPKGEPAEKLLERIKQEKEKFESNNKKRKKR